LGGELGRSGQFGIFPSLKNTCLLYFLTYISAGTEVVEDLKEVSGSQVTTPVAEDMPEIPSETIISNTET